MGLTIVTGPANSAKAAVVLDRCRAAVAQAPILVVPRRADVEHYRRELVGDGASLGATVESFGGLVREIAQRAGVAGRPIGEPARERIIEAVIHAAELDVLAGAARAPGFARALARLVAELEARRVEPGRFTSALRAWAPSRTRRRVYADELAALYRGYRQRLDRLGLLDAELHAARALDALRLAPERWGATPVLCYGFDDLEPLQLDAIETLAHRVDAPVTLSLPGEPGRVALAGRAATLETLRPGADVIELAPLDIHYEDPTLHHLERSLFEDAPARVPAGQALRLLEGGDERAEAELVAAEIAELVAGGCVPGDVAVVTRGASPIGELVAHACAARGVPTVAARRERFVDTALGGGVLAGLRVALLGGDAGDLVRWLRSVGVVRDTSLVDRFEAALLEGAVLDAGTARAVWEAQHWPLDALDRLRASGVALLDAVERELDRLFAAPHRRAAALIDPWEAAVLASGRRTVASLRELALADPRLAPDAARLFAAFERTVVELPVDGAGDAVVIGDALALRAQRVRALFVVGVQEGAFPAAPIPDTFLGAGDRAELAQASGLVLGGPVDPLAAERYLFYALCSRPTAWLRVSWHDTTGDDAPALRSLFVDDLADCFERPLLDRRTVRGAGVVAWPAGVRLPPALATIRRALAAPRRRDPSLGPLSHPDRLAALRGRPAHSPSALERWAACPVAWFVERALHAEPLAPAELPLVRGSAAHELLQDVLVALRDRVGSARVRPATLVDALELLDERLARRVAPLSPDPPLDRTERHRLRSDLRRYLQLLAATSPTHEPEEFELAFGLEGDPHGPVAIGALELCGRIDRIDVDQRAGTAVVIDYKSTSGAPAMKWTAERRFQPALYMRAVEALLGRTPVAGLYQPLRIADQRPRGAVRGDVELGVPVADRDRLDPAEFDALIDAQVAGALEAAREVGAGELRGRPQSCTTQGRCRYPAICRCEAR